MTFGTTWRLFLIAAAVLAAMRSDSAFVYAQTAGPVSIPVVGCPSFGQIDVIDVPNGKSELVLIPQQDGEALAYYKSGDRISVLAPRGWYCQGTSGSSGAALFLGPKPIAHSSSGWEGLGGAVIEVRDISAEGSGRYEVAELMARVFPAFRLLARKVWADLDSPLPAGPYPNDVLTYRGTTVVEYRTPARTEGLGNFHSWIGRNDLPIAGAAILIPDPVRPTGYTDHLVLLSIRLPPDLARLTPVIVGHLEHDVAGGTRK